MFLSLRGSPIRAMLLASFVLVSSRGNPQRAIPDDSLAYPVLVTLGDNSSGSGFFLSSGNAWYLVTARHVLFKSKPPQEVTTKAYEPLELRNTVGRLVSYSKDPADPTKNIIQLDLSLLEKDGNIKQHASQDVAVVRLGTPLSPGQGAKAGEYGIEKALPGVTINKMAKAGFLSVSLDNIKTFDQTLTGNDVMVFGYPSSLGLQNVPQIDYQRPLLRKGIIAGTNPAKRSLILDCSVYPGNSGGPVLEVDKQAFVAAFKIVGVVVEFIPFNQQAASETLGLQLLTNSGYSVALPMDFVLELLK